MRIKKSVIFLSPALPFVCSERGRKRDRLEKMADNDMDHAAELLDYDEEENTAEAAGQNDANGAEVASKKTVKGSYVSIHSSGFRDFLLKPELLRAIVDCGFEHPSEGVIHPHTPLSHGIYPSFSVSALSHPHPQFRTSVSRRPSWEWTWCVRPRVGWGRRPSLSLPLSSSWSQLMDKSASSSCVTLGERNRERKKRLIHPIVVGNFHHIIVNCTLTHLPTCTPRELAFQIYKEYERFSKYFDNIKTSVFFGGISIKKDEEVMKTNTPHIVVGTPGRILALVRDKTLNLKHIKHFILDECDKMLEQLGKTSS